MLADAGCWHLEQMNEITGQGITVLIPPDSSRRKDKPKRPGWNGGAYDFMRAVLATKTGGELYKRHGQTIEPLPRLDEPSRLAAATSASATAAARREPEGAEGAAIVEKVRPPTLAANTSDDRTG